MKELTNRQQQVLHFISSFTEANVCPPTVRETAEYFSISIKAVQDHFVALRKKGYLAPAERGSRSLRVLMGDESIEEKRPCRIPLLGSVAAGIPVLCEENYGGCISVPGFMVDSGSNYFALHVRGDSMIEAGIFDGDLAIIRQQNEAANGMIVVALIEDAVTLKRFFRESSRIRLEAENHNFQTIYCQKVIILGVLSNIIRNY